MRTALRCSGESSGNRTQPPFHARWPALRLALRRAGLVPLALWLALGVAPASLAARAPAADSGGEAARLARLQGHAQSAILDWVLTHSGPITGDTSAGEFRVVYTVTPAEGWWEKVEGGKLAWHDAPAGQVHLRLFVADSKDGRLREDLTVVATLTDANGNVQALPIAFGWYPLINAYSGNISQPADGSYRLRIGIVAADSRDQGLARITWAEFPTVTLAQDVVMQEQPATETSYATEAELLKPFNGALRKAITALWQHSASGAEKAAGDYFVAYALGDTEATAPLARLPRKALREFGAREGTRLEVLVLDSRTGRLIPTLTPHFDLDSDGALYDRGELAPMRQPWLELYGRNVHIPRKGNYRLRVSLEAPGFRRWGRQSNRFAQPAEVEFHDVTLEPAAPAAQAEGTPESKPQP